MSVIQKFIFTVNILALKTVDVKKYVIWELLL